MPWYPLPLTAEQRKVVDLSEDAKVLVTAGPGTGKTHTMIARIHRLVTELDLAPAGEILVLTFTRAAVREIRHRCKAVGGALSYVAVRTFDSYASRLLRQFAPQELATPGTYDDRIQAAIRALLHIEEAGHRIREYRHIFVDEIQDLVGVRAEFVKTLLDVSGSGFSLFGDPAQGIYSFQLPESQKDAGSKILYTWIASRFAEAKEYELTVNHRARTGIARRALAFGRMLNANDVDHEEIYSLISEMAADHEPTVTWAQLPEGIQALSATGSTALLCRTNGQLLDVSEHLWRSQVHHSIRQSSEEEHIPAFMAVALRGFDGTEISATGLKERLYRAGVTDSDSAYDSLRRVAGGTRTGLSVSSLRERLSWGLFPDDLESDENSPIVVSTIHRAKGLEFDTVLFLWGSHGQNVDDVAEEARVVYVALTRATERMVRCTWRRVHGLRRDRSTARWIVRSRAKYSYVTRKVQVNPGDLERRILPGALSDGPKERLRVQHYIQQVVKDGDEVTLVNADPSGLLPHLCFNIVHDGTVIGVTNEGFSNVLNRVISGRWRPGKILGVRVRGLQTVVGDSAETRRLGLGNHGLWLAPRIGGLGMLAD